MPRIKKAPIQFTPYLKSVIWGGTRICEYKAIDQPEPNIGESWEISVLPGHETVVSEGVYRGKTLIELVEEFKEELLGSNSIEKYGCQFPLLIKFIDASHDLSVQVHPDDSLAKSRHNSLGKDEMWYIIDSKKDAKIIAGFKEKSHLDALHKKLEDRSLMDSLAVHESRPGKVFYLPAGTVHAVGSGNLLIEIQESSDITYRIYDYDRLDDSGNKRELHVELAKSAIKYEPYQIAKEVEANLNEMTQIWECEHFKSFKIDLDGEMEVDTSYPSFTVIICISGKAEVEAEEGSTTLKSGYTTLIPASVNKLKLKGKSTILITHI